MPDAPQPQRTNDTTDSSGTREGTGGGSLSGGMPPIAAGDSSRSGTASDTTLGRVLVERGVINQAALDECLRELRARSEQARPTTLPDLLIERRLATADQIDKARTEGDAAKATAKIPGYQILRKLGQGAMAKVYLARQISLDRLVAVKVLPRHSSQSANFIARFQKEGRAAASLSHNNIVAAYEIGEVGGLHYFVMEYVDGDTVYDRIAARKRLPEREALEIIRQVASAL